MKYRFPLGVNQSGLTQVFLDRNQNSVRVPNNCCVDLSTLNGSFLNLLQPVKNFLQFVGDKPFYLRREFALGDTLMVVPVLRALQEQGHNVVLQSGYVELLRLLEVPSFEMSASLETDRYGLILDGVVEQDHVRPPLQHEHRVDIYKNIVGMKEERVEWDWSCDLEKFPANDILGDYIVFQASGTGKKKSLPLETIEWLIKALNLEKVKVIYIGEQVPLKIDSELTELIYRSQSLPQLFTTIAGARCLICMDSAPLWVSHFTNTPVITLLGPSRVEERMTLHPLYPEGAVGIQLNDLIDCKSCFENAKDCDGKISCLNVEPEQLFELIIPYIMNFLNREI